MVLPLNKPIVCPVVIGRTTELTSIQQLVESTKNGQGQVALLCDEAGIGKSRLVKEAKAYATALNFRVFHDGNTRSSGYTLRVNQTTFCC